ncbi:tyrosine-type recombinase/integrase [Intestinibacter sp.]
MPRNALRIYNTNTIEQESSNQNYIEYKGLPIRINIKRNFHRLEFDTLYNKSFRKDWINLDIGYFEDYKSLDKQERAYARLLALYRRINLNFFDCIHMPIKYSRYDIYRFENFQVYNDLFDKYYDEFEMYKSSNNKIKEYFRKTSTIFTLKLWLAGYGIFPGFTENHITDELISEILKYHREHRESDSPDALPKYIRFISYILSQEKKSPVTKVCYTKELTPLLDREISKWDNVIENNPLGKEFKNFVINNFYARTKNSLLIEYKDSQGILRRNTLSRISPGTFTNYSGGLRDMFLELKKRNLDSISTALENGILTVLSETHHKFNKTKYSSMKISIKYWVEWYIQQNNLNLNIYKIVPNATTRRDTTFGKILNINDVVSLIDALVDDNCPFYENLTLSDYRSRYACLLMLSSGQRVSEISCLAYDCIKKHNDNNLYIVFHKTKKSVGNAIVATKDILYYVEKLRLFAPKLPLFFSNEIYPYYDNLKIKRLMANTYNSGPLLESTINKFLERLQKFLWGEDLSKKDKKFSCHDFRRMKATYMSWSGHINESIAKQLGQSNINSQLPYLQTKPVEHQKVFSDIYKQSIYKVDENGEVIINKNRVMDKAVSISVDDNKESHKLLIKSILSNMKKVDDICIEKVDTTVLEPTGFPIGLYSCSAGLLVNCNKSTIKCFSCDNYIPDKDSLKNHKVELFRYILLYNYISKVLKSTKDIIIKNVISEKQKQLSVSIEESFDKLFLKFNLPQTKIDELRIELDKKSKSYSRKYGKNNPSPTFKDAKKYFEEGKL